MSKKQKNKTAAGQLSLSLACKMGALAGAIDPFNELIRREFHQSELSIEQIADRMSALLGRSLSVPNLRKKIEQNESHRLDADETIAACFVFDLRDALDALMAPVGWSVANQRQRDLAELGQIVLDEEDLAARKSAVRRRLGR